MPGSLETLESQELEESVPVLTEEEQLSEFPVFGEDLFVTGQTNKVKKSRSEKRAERRSHWFENHTAGNDDEAEPTRHCHALDVSADEMKVLQDTDTTLQTLKRAAEDDPSEGGYFLRDGLLFRRWTPPGRDVETMAVDQLVLPLQCRDTVLNLAHSTPCAGHLGKDKTTDRIFPRFYWPTVHRDVADFCRQCAVCQKTTHYRPSRVPMIPLPVMVEPFQRVAMDLIGPLPKSRSGKRYVLVMCDYATRYPEAVPLKSIDAGPVAEELVTIISRVGVPREILTDQGTNFTSKLLKEIYRLLHVHPIRTTPYHPQCDGLVERFNRTLKSMLRKAAVKEGRDRDRLIPYLLFAYREVPQASTGFSPFELLYGRAVRGPLDVLKETWEATEPSSESVVSYVLSVRNKLEKMTDLVQDNLVKAQQHQKFWYDQNAVDRELKPDNHVLVLLPTNTNKLLAQWQGPYRVLERRGQVDYVIDMHDRKKRRRTFYINMLKKWHGSVESALSAEEVESSESESGLEEVLLWKDDSIQKPVIGNQLSEEQKSELQALLDEFSDIFRDSPGRTDLTEHAIHTGDAAPVKLPPYRVPHAYRIRTQVKQELDEMLEAGIIEPSNSNWSAPMIVVTRQDRPIRLCVDYRRLNTVSKMDAYPMPRIDDLIDGLGKAKYISTIDLTRGYWQVPLSQESREKSAFATPYGLFQFNVMPFGLQGAPATFQRLVDKVLQGCEEYADAYFDDVIDFSETWKAHLVHLREVLTRLRAANLTLRGRKCKFGVSECVYLGHRVGNGMIQPEQSKVDAVRNMVRPGTKKQVRKFLGLTGYYRRFIPNYATIAAPLSDLTRKSLPKSVIWTVECERAFQQIKDCLCSSPVLYNPDFDREFFVQTDASDRGCGAVLGQTDQDGCEHPVAYFSRKFLPREEKYSAVEKECLAIKCALQAFRIYLLGKRFTVYTDHRSLMWLDRLRDTNPRLTRWSLALQPYSFEVIHQAGTDNTNADALSRIETKKFVLEKGGGM